MMNYYQDVQKNLKQSDMEPFNHGDGNESVNDQSKCNIWVSNCSAAIDTDWRRRTLNQFDDGDHFDNWCLLYQWLYLTIIDTIRWLMTFATINVNEQQLMTINDDYSDYTFTW